MESLFTPNNDVAVQTKSKPNSAFQMILDHLNAKSIGDLVTRKNLLRLMKSMNGSPEYADGIRRKLTAAGYLREHSKRGVYYLQKFPQEITSTQLDFEYWISSRNLSINDRYRAYHETVIKFIFVMAEAGGSSIASRFKPKDFKEVKVLTDAIRSAENGTNLYELMYVHQKRENARSYENQNYVMNLYLSYLVEPKRFAHNKAYFEKEEAARNEKLNKKPIVQPLTELDIKVHKIMQTN